MFISVPGGIARMLKEKDRMLLWLLLLITMIGIGFFVYLQKSGKWVNHKLNKTEKIEQT